MIFRFLVWGLGGGDVIFWSKEQRRSEFRGIDNEFSLVYGEFKMSQNIQIEMQVGVRGEGVGDVEGDGRSFWGVLAISRVGVQVRFYISFCDYCILLNFFWFEFNDVKELDTSCAEVRE